MAVWLFTEAVLAQRPIRLFNHGDMRRDFTYVDDIVSGIVGCLDTPFDDDGTRKPGGSNGPHRLYNIGNNSSERLDRLVELIEQACGRPAIRTYEPMQPGDVKDTAADITTIQRDIGFSPSTSLEVGIPRFVEWYLAYTGG